ncbi:MAG: bifunctional ADP-dependent NAD(P)H-hydrate dehydratase/NAD(P)H-hydrate epimerase [Rhodocyclaceae bacterium]|jgi:hydroxyethylthiazole kinase-like uncharacterized protein yjeF|nr:bifunctional ADP-dependent NAD(P)H-hydrate dehydratase/NAD(P)H-hydrate epimerase [Rhodocyclaceae bacterium]
MHSAASRPIYHVAQIREIESRRAKVTPPLMERAGAAAAHVARALTRGTRLSALILCGPGNNGGDGFVVARLLRQRGFSPTVVFRGDPERLPDDARHAWHAWHAIGGDVAHEIPRRHFSLAIDALFGSGLQRPIEGEYADLIDRINHLECPVLALDIPSGLHADSGRVLGCAVRAAHTATFIALKPGLLTLDGPDHCGDISVHDLDLNPESVLPADAHVITPALFPARLVPRPKNSHKGMMGGVGIIGGAPGMVGAALLAGRAALKLGAGRIYVGLIDNKALAVDTDQPELMLREPQEVLSSGFATALAVGPGLGRGSAALALLRQTIRGDLPLVLDADALNLLASHPVLAGHVQRRGAPTLLTPHPLEAARLLATDIAEIRDDRVRAALALAKKLNAVTVLKGCGSIVALPSGRWHMNTSGNPGMASAGMGDVLTGLAAALLAQGWDAEHALLCAVHLHGLAADRLVEQGIGPAGLTAGETIDAARNIFNGWAKPRNQGTA